MQLNTTDNNGVANPSTHLTLVGEIKEIIEEIKLLTQDK